MWDNSYAPKIKRSAHCKPGKTEPKPEECKKLRTQAGCCKLRGAAVNTASMQACPWAPDQSTRVTSVRSTCTELVQARSFPQLHKRPVHNRMRSFWAPC